jgi:hypothetical protein
LVFLRVTAAAAAQEKQSVAVSSPRLTDRQLAVVKKAEAGSMLPKPVHDLRAGTYKYRGAVSLGGSAINIDVSITIAEENGTWKASDMVMMPTGEASDISTLEKSTLIVRKRTVQQGAATVEVNFSDSKATGTVDFNGKQKTIDVDLGGPLFADAAGSALTIGCLPLAEGYTASFRNFDLFKQTPQLMELKVAGSAQITVPAGTFDTFKVELASADGGADKSTLWIAKGSRTPVKASIMLSQIGGATLTEELLP